MESVRNHIENHIREITQFAMNDLLVDISNKSSVFECDTQKSEEFKITPTAELKTILKSAENHFKETGISPLCLSVGAMSWLVKSKLVETPIFLIPLDFKKSKIEEDLTFTLSDSGFIFNPFLVNTFKEIYELELPEIDFSIDIIHQFETWVQSLNLDFQFTEKYTIGNFHHHRFQILRDLEELSLVDDLNENVQQLLGKEDVKSDYFFEFDRQLLYASDNDHLDVLETIQQENCVIQGPPGTGKSQVLTNILGKSLNQGLSTLVISEKRVALEVLQKKLSKFGLDDFTFVTTSETNASDFLKSLEQTWYKMDTIFPRRTNNLLLSEQYKDYLQLQLDLLSKKELVGGVTFDEFHQLSKEIDFTNANYFSDVPFVSEWLVDQKSIQEIYTNKSNLALQFLPFHVVKSAQFLTFDQLVIEWKKMFELLQNIYSFDTLFSLDEVIKKAAICQLIENESKKNYFKLLIPNSPQQKKYKSLRKRYLKLKNEVDLIENEKQNWKEFPSQNETEYLLSNLENGSFWNKRKARKRINQLANSSFIDHQIALRNWKEYLDKNNSLSLIKNEFCEIELNEPEIDLTIIDLLILQIKANDWELYLTIPEIERKRLSDCHVSLGQLKSNLKTYFSLSETQSISFVFESIETYFSEVIRLQKKLELLSERSYKLLSKCENFPEYEQVLFKGNWINFERYFPELAQFNFQKIGIKISEIIQLEEEENKLFGEQIIQKIQDQFQKYHTLLQSSTVRLSEEEKAFKKRLKKGKSILVKEFSKTRNHPSIRELLKTEAVEWIKILKPIWLSNPVQVSTCFPLKANLFDIVLFDEASQIPLTNALGSIHRGKRIIVAGDDQQMGPSSFFKVGSTDVVDLLHQSNFYWKTISLQHHYRSQFPSLIQFSNTHFYSNSLIAYPSAKQNHQPLNWYYCEKGIYKDNQNLEEAKVVAGIIESRLKSSLKENSIGIVAFSESQLAAIWKALPTEQQLLLQDKIDQNLTFFKSLENVQGEECDELIISLGYARNEEGDFHMRFGPLNQKNGNKRLNVLLTRAKETIHFVSSVKSSDFKLTENESIRLLKLFLAQIETQEEKSIPMFPHHLKPIVDFGNNTVTFQSIVQQLSNVNELVTLQRVLENRGWKVCFQ